MSKPALTTISDIPNWPICPVCGSRFLQVKGDEYVECPDCRESDLTVGERLTLGFDMLNQAEYDNH